MINEEEVKGREEKVKRSRRKKDEVVSYELNKEQSKFFVDLSKHKTGLEKIQSLLIKANNKQHGREITFRDIVLYLLDKVSDKDIEKIQEFSLTEMEKVQKLCDEYNTKNGTSLLLGEFLVKKLNIN